MPLEQSYKFLPQLLLTEFNQELLQAMEFAYTAIPTPLDYQHLRYAYGVAEFISKIALKYNGSFKRVIYDPFPKTGYGRYGLKENSFEILSCSKQERGKIESISEDYILVEFDYNAFEIRTLLALCKIKQPQEDLYTLLSSQQNKLSRDEFKKFMITKLYSNNPDKILLNIIQKRKLKEKFPLKNGKVINIFGKILESDEYHYYSRLLQSTAAYILFQQMFKLISYIKLNNLKSNIAFCIHDSICMNVHSSEKQHILEFKKILSNVDIENLNYRDDFLIKTKQGIKYSGLEVIE